MGENRKYNITGSPPKEIKSFLEYGDRIEIPIHNLEHVLNEFDKDQYHFFAVVIHKGKASIQLSESIAKEALKQEVNND